MLIVYWMDEDGYIVEDSMVTSVEFNPDGTVTIVHDYSSCDDYDPGEETNTTIRWNQIESICPDEV